MSPLSCLFLSSTVAFGIANAYPVTSAKSSSSDSQIPLISCIRDASCGPIPSESSFYSDYRGVAAPFPANQPAPVPAADRGLAGPDDLLFQNLLSAEWVIYSFYQAGVEAFNADDFTKLGFPNTTYDRIQEIRDNEAGHLRIFQDSISNNSIKPGICKYDFGFGTDPTMFLELSSFIEIGSMAFLTGLIQQANTNVSKGALTAVGETETRHEVWGLIDIFHANPFAGSADTAFPYANQILDTTRTFIIPGSCPAENPVYPSPARNLPQFAIAANQTSLVPGANITFTYSNAGNVPTFSSEKEYFAVFFHGVQSISVPFNTKTNTSVIPEQFEARGLIIAVIADEKGAPTEESVVAGPLLILEPFKSA